MTAKSSSRKPSTKFQQQVGTFRLKQEKVANSSDPVVQAYGINNIEDHGVPGSTAHH